MHETFMRMAIEKAREGIKKDQSPFGACIVGNNEKVVSIAHNEVWQTTDSTAHAEVQAIRYACKKLKTINLSGCSLYSTCEPCPMCFSAIHWARIDTIYFGVHIEDAQKTGFNELSISNESMKSMSGSTIKIYSGLRADEVKNLFAEWMKNSNKKTY